LAAGRNLFIFKILTNGNLLFLFLTLIFLKICASVSGFLGSTPSSGALFRSFFRNVKKPNWLLKLEKDYDWLTSGKWRFL
jgi:hypothetical protein